MRDKLGCSCALDARTMKARGGRTRMAGLGGEPCLPLPLASLLHQEISIASRGETHEKKAVFDSKNELIEFLKDNRFVATQLKDNRFVATQFKVTKAPSSAELEDQIIDGYISLFEDYVRGAWQWRVEEASKYVYQVHCS